MNCTNMCRATTATAEEDLEAKDAEMLAKLRMRQRQQTMNGDATGSVSANDRLMKELRDIYRSKHYKRGEFVEALSLKR